MLEAPERDYVPGPVTPRRVSASPNLRLRQDFDDDVYQDVHEDLDEEGGARLTQRRPGLRLSLRGLPRTRAGRIAAGVGALLLAAMCVGVLVEAHSLLMHDERFFIPSTSSIEIEGNTHVTRAELLSVFGAPAAREPAHRHTRDRRAHLFRTNRGARGDLAGPSGLRSPAVATDPKLTHSGQKRSFPKRKEFPDFTQLPPDSAVA